MIAEPPAATVNGGNGGRGVVESGDVEAVVLACGPFDDDEQPVATATTATNAKTTARFTAGA